MIARRNRHIFIPRRKRRPGGSFTSLSARHAWVVVAVTVLSLLLATRAQWLRRAVILDAVSLWPVPVAAIGVLAVGGRLRRRRNRAPRSGSAIAIPLLVFTWLVAGLALHFTGWEQLPSQAVVLQGPMVSDRLVTAELHVQTGGEVVLEGEGEFLYEVTPLRNGGVTAPARGSELIDGGNAIVDLTEAPEAGWYGSSGWRVLVSGTPRWDLTVRAPVLSADLTAIRLQSLSVSADGRIRLGPPSGDVPVRLSGGVVLEVPSNVSVEVVGPARVGSGWETTATGTRYTGTADSAFLVVVEPGSDLIVEQW